MDWQFNVLGHVRSVHFALVGLSVALLIATTLLPSASIEEAYRQLGIVDVIRERQMTFGAVEPAARESGVHFLISGDQFEVTPLAYSLSDQISEAWSYQRQPFFIVAPPDEQGDWHNRPFSVGSASWDATPRLNTMKFREHIFWTETSGLLPDNLARFAKVWNFLGDAWAAKVNEVDLSAITFYTGGDKLDECSAEVLNENEHPFGCVIKKPFSDTAEFADAKFGLIEIVDESLRLAPRQWYIVVMLDIGTNPFDEIRVPIKLSRLDYPDPQQMVLGDALPQVAGGAASEVFGDLYEVAAGLETLSFQELSPYIRRLRDDRKDQVSLLGLNVPLGLVGQWGLFILLAFQIYFLAHVHHLWRLKIDPSILQRFPWIALYPGRLPLVIFLLTASGVPALSAIVLAAPALSLPWNPIHDYLLAGLAVSSICIAALTLWTIWKWKGDVIRHTSGAISDTDS